MRDALLLAARERDRVRALAPEQAHLVERGADPPGGVARRDAGDRQRQQHVVEHAAVEQQPLVLQHEAEVAAQEGDRGAGSPPTFCRLTSTVPPLGRSIAASRRKTVLLPAPECPVRKTNSPAATSKLASSSAGADPAALPG